ncbi:MAG TPA: FAD-dependent oxidoreductase, partial [Acidimicrobiia bacterium]
MSRVVVLGDGPAGLPATLLEREERTGGLAGGTGVDGMRVDLGSHRLHPSIDTDILVDLIALLGDGLQRRQRHGRIRMAGTWIALPLSPGEMLASLPLGVAARLGLG